MAQTYQGKHHERSEIKRAQITPGVCLAAPYGSDGNGDAGVTWTRVEVLKVNLFTHAFTTQCADVAMPKPKRVYTMLFLCVCSSVHQSIDPLFCFFKWCADGFTTTIHGCCIGTFVRHLSYRQNPPAQPASRSLVNTYSCLISTMALRTHSPSRHSARSHRNSSTFRARPSSVNSMAFHLCIQPTLPRRRNRRS